MAKKNMKIRMGFIKDVKKAYKRRAELSQYAEISLFQEPYTQFCKRDTPRLDKWTRRFITAAYINMHISRDREGEYHD